jgi:pimeloyl-ACP methyl ester carboxylesterase
MKNIDYSSPLSFSRLLIILIGVAFFGFQPQSMVYSSTPDQNKTVPRFVEGSCSYIFPNFDWKNVVLGRFRCGYLVTWENYDTQSGTIWLSVMETYPKGSKPYPEPIIWLAGGPGGPGFPLDPAKAINYADGFERGWIQFSQRGAAFSKHEQDLSDAALYCRGDNDTQSYHDAIIDRWKKNVGEKPLNWEEWSSVRSQALVECSQDLEKEHGANYLANINSKFSALDVIQLIRELGYGGGHANLYGGSYGTLLAQHVLDLSPGDVHSVVLEGVAPLGVDWVAEYPRNMRNSLQRIFDACSTSSKCREAYPNLEQTFFVLLDQLKDQPLCPSVTDRDENVCLDDYGFLLALGQMLYKSENIKGIPRIIDAAWKRDVMQIPELWENFYVYERNENWPWGMYYSVYCNEFARFDPDSIDLRQIEQQFQTIYTASKQIINNVCPHYDKNEKSYGDIEIENANVPILIFNGKFDPGTAMKYGQQVADALSIGDDFQFTFERSAHDSANSDCARSIIINFFHKPEDAPNRKCWEKDNQQPIEFALPSGRFKYDSMIVTFPEYLILKPGEVGTITIDIQNTGFLPWTAAGDFALVNTNEQSLGAVPVQLLLGEIPPGYIARWTISLQAPPQAGLYWTVWQMTNLGKPFGPEVTGLVMVAPNSETDLNPSLLFRGWLDGLLNDLQRQFSEWLRMEIERQMRELLETLVVQLCGGAMLMPVTIVFGTWVVRRKKRYPGNEN